MQEKARDAAQKVLGIVPLVMRVVAAEMRSAPHGVMPGHLRLLGMLHRAPRSLSDLAEMHAVSLPTISNTITTLEDRGWVRRTRSTEDRRVVLAELTERGCDVLDEAAQRSEEHIAGILASLTDLEMNVLVEGLDVLNSAFSEAMQSSDSALSAESQKGDR
jgi:DNA-binding MarR family transcriptional regulator